MVAGGNYGLGDVPVGWRALDGRLRPDRTLAGAIARHQEVRGLCRQRDCKRTCHLDLAGLTRRGFGGVGVSDLLQLWRCHRLDVLCGLEFHFDPIHPHLPLSTLAGRSHVLIRIRCDTPKCMTLRTTTPEALARRLEAEGKGGARTEVAAIAGLISGKCKACQRSAWRVDVLWPDTSTIGWRARHGGV